LGEKPCVLYYIGMVGGSVKAPTGTTQFVQYWKQCCETIMK